jgi:hypothetical protein
LGLREPRDEDLGAAVERRLATPSAPGFVTPEKVRAPFTVDMTDYSTQYIHIFEVLVNLSAFKFISLASDFRHSVPPAESLH